MTPASSRSLSEDSLGFFLDEIVDHAIFMIDREGIVVTWAPSGERILGFTAAEIIGQPVSRFHTEEECAAGRPAQLIAGAEAEGRMEDTGWRVRKDGTRFWADVVITALRDEAGGIRGYAKVVRDLTHRREAEENARRLVAVDAARATAEQHAREIQRHAHRLHVLAEASRDFAELGMDFDAALQGLVQRCASAMGDACGLLLLSEDRTMCQVKAFSARSPAEREAGTSFIGLRVSAKSGFSGRGLAQGTNPLRIPIVDAAFSRQHADPRFATYLRDFPIHSFMATPLISGREVVGVVCMARHDSAEPYTEDDLSLLQDLVARSELALRSIGLFKDQVALRATAERSADRQARLQATTAALAHLLTPEEAGAAAVEQSLGALEGTTGAVYVLSRGGTTLRLLASRGIGADRLRTYGTVAVDSSLPIAECVRRKRPLYFVERTELEARVEGFDARTAGIEACALLPLMVHTEVVGAMMISFREPRPFKQDDREFIEAIATQCASALDRAALRERERVQSERTAFLARAGELLSSSLDYETVLRKLVSLAVPGFADWCTVDVVEGDHIQRLTVAHADPEKARWGWELSERFPVDSRLGYGVAAVIRKGLPEHYPEISGDILALADASPGLRESLEKAGLRSVLIVPLLSRGVGLGALSMAWAETPRNYDEEDLAFAMDLARRAAMAVENARLYREVQTAVEIRDDFLAVAGHELKTPLTTLLNQVQGLERVMRREGGDPSRTDRLKKATHAGFRLERLVSQMLDVARLSSGQLVLEPEAVDVTALVRGIVERFREEDDSVLVSFRGVDGMMGLVDPHRFERVLSNLLANARKYGRGQPIDVEVARSDGDGVIRVIDRGIGIDPSRQPRIFERFERAVGAREFGGFGLGLWIARQIVEASGGRITVDSRPDEGSVFTVYLPLSV
jgi:PAS domain S-box-containing protein